MGVPVERRIEFRVGVHISDVAEGSDGDSMRRCEHCRSPRRGRRRRAKTALQLNPKFSIRLFRAGAQSDNPVFLKQRERNDRITW
jgi:hypothetical protein